MGSHFLTNVFCYQFDGVTIENAVNQMNNPRDFESVGSGVGELRGILFMGGGTMNYVLMLAIPILLFAWYWLIFRKEK